MSKRELKSLDAVTESGETCTGRKLRSGTVLRRPPSQQPEPEAMDDEAATLEAAQIIELQQKLALAEQAVNEKDRELREMENKLGEVEKKAEELEQARDAATTKLAEASEALDQATEKFVAERSELIGRVEELEKNVSACSECAARELEGQGMKMELEKLREVEALRRKFDLEREQHRLEREKDAAVIAELKLALEPKKGEPPRVDSEKLVETGEDGDSPTDPSVNGESLSVKPGTRGEPSKEPGVGEGSRSDKRGEPSKDPGAGEGSPSGEPSKEPGAGESSHSKKKSVTFSEPIDKGKGHGKQHSSPNLGCEKGAGCGVPGESEGPVVEKPPGAHVVDGTDGLIQSVARLIKTQTELMAAQTKAMTAQSLPPLAHFTGEGSLVGEESFDRWHEQFEERSVVAGWSEEQKKYQLKMHLDKTAFQACRMLPKEAKGSYGAMVKALRERFRPVDIEELRGMEFHQITQETESVEEIGIKLQVLAREAFPNVVGKEVAEGALLSKFAPKMAKEVGSPETRRDL